MPATTTVTYGSNTNTQSSIISELQIAMANAGFSASPYDSTSSSLVYEYTFSTNAKGKVYIQINISSALQISEVIFDSWNISTDTGTNASATTNTTTISANSPITYTAINHPELRGVIINTIDSGRAFIGYFRPANKPDWWNESNHVYCFNPHSLITGELSQLYALAKVATPFNSSTYTAPTHVYSIHPRSYSSTYVASPSNDIFSALNPAGRRDIIAGLPVYGPYFNGSSIHNHSVYCGSVSSEIAIAYTKDLSRLDKLIILPGVEEYLLLATGSNIGMLVRTI